MLDFYTVSLILFLISICIIMWVFYQVKNFTYDNIEILNEIKIKQGLVLILEYNTMKYLSWDVKPYIDINNRIYQRKWGAHEIDLDSGQYTIIIYFTYMGFKECGKQTIFFELIENQVKEITYRAPLVVADKGKINIRDLNEEH